MYRGVPFSRLSKRVAVSILIFFLFFPSFHVFPMFDVVVKLEVLDCRVSEYHTCTFKSVINLHN